MWCQKNIVKINFIFYSLYMWNYNIYFHLSMIILHKIYYNMKKKYTKFTVIWKMTSKHAKITKKKERN